MYRLIEIFVKAKDELVLELGLTNGYWMTIAGFFGGMLINRPDRSFYPGNRESA